MASLERYPTSLLPHSTKPRYRKRFPVGGSVLVRQPIPEVYRDRRRVSDPGSDLPARCFRPTLEGHLSAPPRRGDQARYHLVIMRHGAQSSVSAWCGRRARPGDVAERRIVSRKAPRRRLTLSIPSPGRTVPHPGVVGPCRCSSRRSPAGRTCGTG